MAVTKLETQAEFESFLQTDKPVVMYFYATWCGLCGMITAKVGAMAQDFPNVAFGKVDIEKNKETCKKCGIEATPTFKVYKDGEPVVSMVSNSEEKIRGAINQAIKDANV